MSSRRAARCHDLVGIDAELARILAKPADGAAGIVHAFLGCDAVARLDTIISPCRHHPPTGKILRLWLKLLDRATFPAAAEKEHDGGPLVGVLPVWRKMDDEFQVGLLRL